MSLKVITFFVSYCLTRASDPWNANFVEFLTFLDSVTLCAGQIFLTPSPPLQAPPGTSLFLGVAPVLLSLYFFLAPPYIITNFTLFFFSAPPFFITHIFPLTPRLPQGDGVRTIWPVHNK